MNFYDVLDSIKNQIIYLHSDNEILLPTKEINLNLSTKEFDVKIPINTSNLKEILGLLNYSLKDATIISWKIKNIKSHILKSIKANFVLNNLYDLNILESYSGIFKNKPISFTEAISRFQSLSKLPNWQDNIKVYKNVFIDLFDTLSEMESIGVIHKTKKIKLFSHYEIDGQINGR